MARSPYAAPLALALALTVVGCSDGSPAPEASGTPSASEETSTTPTTEAPERLGPVETVRAWVDAYNDVVEGADPEVIDSLSSDSCTTCDDWVAPILKVRRNGGRIENDGRQIIRIRRDPEFARTRIVVTALQFTGGRTWPRQGADPVEYASENYIIEFELTREDGPWLVNAITYID